MCIKSRQPAPTYRTSARLLMIGLAWCQTAAFGGDSTYKSVSYQLAPGQTVGYALKMEVHSPKSSQFIGGVACFWGEAVDRRVVRAKSRDNLRLTNSANDLPFAFPMYSNMLDQNFAVNKYGEPLTGVNGKLPMLLGDLEELFYPPLPKKGSVRSESRDIYHFGDGQFKFYGNPPVEDGLRGKFHWSTSYVSRSGNVVRYVHQRQLATNDMRYQLVAQGPIEVDAGTGRLRSQSLSGQCVFDGPPASFSISVYQLSHRQLSELAAAGR